MIRINVIYFDYGGSHTSVVAAHIHAGRLTANDTPPLRDLLSLPYFDKTAPDDFGKIRPVGTDAQDNDIYVLGTKSGNSGGLLSGLLQAQNLAEKFRLIDTMPAVNIWLRIGGWLSRSLSLPFLGRPLIGLGMKKSYPQLKTMVREAGKTSLMEVLQ